MRSSFKTVPKSTLYTLVIAERTVDTSSSERTNLLSYIVISIDKYILLVSTFSPHRASTGTE